MQRSPVAVFVLIACLGFATPTHAAGWRYRLDARTADVAIERMSANADGQLWTAGSGPTSLMLARYDGGAAPALTLTLPPAVVGFDAIRTTRHGDLVTVRFDAPPSTRCYIVKYFADGRRRWSQTLPECAGDASAGSRLFAAADDGEWVALPTQAIKLSADGRVLERIATASLAGKIEAVDPHSDTLYATGERADGSGIVAAYDRRGAERWRTRVAAPVRIAVADDGSLRVVGSGSTRFAAALGPDGVLRWSTPVGTAAPGGDANLAPPLVDADGTTLATAGDDAAVKLDANGRVVWRVRRDAIDFPPAPTAPGAALAPNGDLVLAYGDRIARIGASGSVRYTRRIAPSGEMPPQAGAIVFEKDGTAIVAVRETQPPRTTLARIGVDGADLAAPAPPAAPAPAAAPPRALLPDGSIVAWTYTSGARELVRIAADGKPLWRRATPDASGADDGFADAIAADAARVCTLGTAATGATVVACRRSSDGEPLWSRTLDGDASGTRARLHVAADGSVVAWYGAAGASLGRVAHVRFDRDGRVLSTTALDGAALVETGPADAPYALIATADDAFVVDAAGAERYRVAAPPERLRSAGFDADGGLVATIDDAAEGTVAVRYEARGQRLWSSALPAGIDGDAPPIVDGNAVYVASCCDEPSQYRITRLALTDGATAWRRAVTLSPDAAPRAPALALTPDGAAIVAVGSPGRTLDVDVLATQDGVSHGRLRERCNDAACAAAAPLVAADGRVHVVEIGVAGASLAGLPLPGAQPPVRVDQLGLTGAWWSPYADGEGFVLDYLPESRTLFMPWFTYSRDGGNDPSALRWYAVQGQIAPNATSADLVISEATGGAFDAGPIVAAKRVGTATLTFTDCDNGTLTYAFDDGGNRGARGSISLARLSPATEPCLLADGTVRPGAGARPFANGFDARMSGSWFKRTTSGQGLQFVVQPGAYLFIPWFTYDPAGSADDPGAQRWFTLQGSLERARDGLVEVPIVQTVGGAFDRVPTNNASIVGKATLRMLACDRARLDYRFDDSDAAGAMRTRAGSMDLDKIGGCAQR